MKILSFLALVPSLWGQTVSYLTISGDPVGAAAIELAYASFPARGKEHPISVEIVLPEVWGRDDGTVGTYMYFMNRARILGGMTPEDIAFTFAHEFGHHVWHNSLTYRERKDWSKGWTNNRHRMPRVYATSNACEGFAECYAIRFLVPGEPSVFGYIAGFKLDEKVAERINKLLRVEKPRT